VVDGKEGFGLKEVEVVLMKLQARVEDADEAASH
jgi:hypothetical protein